ncbi:MAG: adenosylcobyric acid synthase, partial [Campylobacterota bacterium]|nr:adenosylcobyric acid synthase [Campylobacterota bacterium]
ILLKPQKETSSQVIINGKAASNKSASEYFKEIDALKPIVKSAFLYLQKNHDFLICEGAGSPVELNIIDKDLSNNFIAKEFDTKIILVADIEKGGVFASIYGTLALLDEKLRKNIIGVIINKFRGDMSLFDDGIKIIENDFKVKVLGVMPYLALNSSFEDALSIANYAIKKSGIINIAVIKFPHISNFTDFEPFIVDEAVNVEFIDTNKTISSYDMIILPGTKATINDLRWLKKIGLFDSIKNSGKKIFGICGGYQMLFSSLLDPHGIESEKNGFESGFGFIDDEIIFSEKKELKKGSYEIFGHNLSGYEIHCGISKKYPLWYKKDDILGTHLHGIFENDDFRSELLGSINPNYKGFNYNQSKNNELENLAKTFKKAINIEMILKELR